MMQVEGGFSARLDVDGAAYTYYPVSAVAGSGKLPYSLTVLLENVLRNAGDLEAARDMASRIVDAGLAGVTGGEIEFSPARVLFQDFTGVPVFVDFAVMREACASLGGDPRRINPLVPCDLVIDHSVIADEAGCAGALAANMEKEFARNKERYSFLKWAQNSFENVRIVPPGKGICHQLNIEQFATVVMHAPESAGAGVGAHAPVVYFDTLVGTDSHTPTANGIGVLGWGVGGIEAEAAALGQPITTLVPRVVGVRLTGALRLGVTAMDVALTFTQTLRAKGVVGCFVECFGEGLASLSATQRTCISNMTPEYGSTCTLFPVDEKTLGYLRLTGRSERQVALVEAYAKAQGLWYDAQAPERVYSDVVEIDLSSVGRSLAGPSRPHDRIPLEGVRARFHEICNQRGLDLSKRVSVATGTVPAVGVAAPAACAAAADATCVVGAAPVVGATCVADASANEASGACEITHGAVAIAAVTSCTTATDPSMMLAAGLLARNAAARGLRSKPWVKTILAPGSHATELLLDRAGLLPALRDLGFFTCGFGCMSCIGNSGPLSQSMHDAAGEVELASVLSGNRNFEGRISPDVSQNYLAAPAMVVAYALAGTVDIDLTSDALGKDAQGNDVYLSDIWPSDNEVADLVAHYVTRDLYEQGSADLFAGDASWDAIDVDASDTFSWDEDSTYVRRPPYFDGMTCEPKAPAAVDGARVLALLGDFITTDHISPAGAIAPASPAARYLEEHGVASAEFNTYGARRGNHEVMMRGTFANVKLANKLAEGKRGGWTYDFARNKVTSVFDAAMDYRRDGVPLVVLAGKMYGSGSSRDWAAKGPALLGVRAAIAESFERIHRSNLIGMGILPLQFEDGQNVETLGLTGAETYTVAPVDFSGGLPNPAVVDVCAVREDGSRVDFKATVRIDTPTEGKYFENGGILPFVLRGLAE